MPLQLRSLKSVSFLAAPSAVAMIIVLVLLIAGITESSDVGRPESAVENEAGVPPVSFFHLIGASSSFTFAYQGHSRFLEISGKMVDQPAK